MGLYSPGLSSPVKKSRSERRAGIVAKKDSSSASFTPSSTDKLKGSGYISSFVSSVMPTKSNGISSKNSTIGIRA